VTSLNAATVRAARRKLYQDSFYEFVKAGWSVVEAEPYVDNWHIEAICDHLQAVAEGRITRLLINIPPRLGKSRLASVLFPAWLWTRKPSKKIISTSHGDDLSTGHTVASRDLILSQWYQELWPTRLKSDQNQKTSYSNDKLGTRQALPFGSVTGWGANVLIVDDPHSVKSGESDAMRKTTVDLFFSSLKNRLNNMKRDAIIVIMQRLHEDDLSGKLLESDSGYVHLCIPMEFEGDKTANAFGWVDPRTEDGELLFPARFPPSVIEELKKGPDGLGLIKYAGQYQQRPVPRDDGFFVADWFNRYKAPANLNVLNDLPRGCNFYMTSDHAPGGSGDYNVFRIWAVDGFRNVYLVDSFRKKCTMDVALGVTKAESGRMIAATAGALPLIRKWRPLSWFPENDPTWVTWQGFVRAAMIDTNIFCRVSAMSPRGDKMSKASPYQAKASIGQVFLPEGPIGDEALAEYLRFPNAKHDDQVDADAAICRAMDEAITGFYVPPPKEPSALDYDPPQQHAPEGDLASFF
jgi:hypothetical protein